MEDYKEILERLVLLEEENESFRERLNELEKQSAKTTALVFPYRQFEPKHKVRDMGRITMAIDVLTKLCIKYGIDIKQVAGKRTSKCFLKKKQRIIKEMQEQFTINDIAMAFGNNPSTIRHLLLKQL